ncbi:MAG: hypothetical protein GY820_17085 [Gammaproteobacteria bacterium]|nr:hypothetical protein [Gammaproteobacteria bacterium]
MAFEDFDFMAEPPEEKPPLDKPDDYVPKSGKPPLITNKDLAQSMLNVFDRLGREAWLIKQAHLDPKGFMTMLSKMIPKSIDADDLQGLSITLVDQYIEGDQKILINRDVPRSPALPASAALSNAGAARAATRHGGGPAQLGQPSDRGTRTATSGNPEIEVVDTYEVKETH